MTNTNIMRDRQVPLQKLYRREPKAAWVTDRARTEGALDDPLHRRVVMNELETLPVAVHTAVGGESDAPVPGDILAAALASCLDSTTRVIADRMGIPLVRLSVRVHAEVDVRGTLMVDPAVPVGFQQLSATLDVEAAEGTPEAQVEQLVKLAEHCCVVMQTLRAGVPIRLTRAATGGSEADAA